MPSGRKPLPSNVLRLKSGAEKPSRLNPDEPKVAITIPPPPDTLPEEHHDIWVDTARKLAGMGVMSEVDTHALEIYCANFARWRDAEARVRENGMIVKSPNGYPMQNPFLAIAKKAEERCVKILIEFGMTPSARTRVSTRG